MSNSDVPTPWIDHYPPGVPAQADTLAYRSLVDLLEAAFRKNAKRDALCCMDSRLTFGDIDKLSEFAGDHIAERLARRRRALQRGRDKSLAPVHPWGAGKGAVNSSPRKDGRAKGLFR